MTFEQFQGTKTRCEDLQARFPDVDFGEGGPFAGFIYCGELHIVAGYGQLQRDFHLVIANEEHASEDLEELERTLYAYALAEGFTA